HDSNHANPRPAPSRKLSPNHLLRSGVECIPNSDHGWRPRRRLRHFWAEHRNPARSRTEPDDQLAKITSNLIFAECCLAPVAECLRAYRRVASQGSRVSRESPAARSINASHRPPVSYDSGLPFYTSRLPTEDALPSPHQWRDPSHTERSASSLLL